jgi:hypothetical protein
MAPISSMHNKAIRDDVHTALDKGGIEVTFWGTAVSSRLDGRFNKYCID